MTVYEFRAIAPSGETVEDTVDAKSLEAASGALENRGFTPLEVRQRGDAAMSDRGRSGSRAGRLSSGRTPTRRSRLDRRSLAVFSRQFGTMLRSGVSVARALETLRDQAPPDQRPIYQGVMNAVDKGDPLSEAFSYYPRSFPRLYVATIAAAERVGALSTAFRQLGDMLQWDLGIRRSVRSALQYPATVVGIVIVAIIVLTQLVVPQFAKAFGNLGGELPIPTRMLLGFSSFLGSYWWLVIAALVAGAILFARYYRTEKGELVVDRLLLELPLVGKLLHRMYLARFARVLGLLQANGLPILTTLEVLGDTIGNAELARHVAVIREDVQRGESLADSVGRSAVFTSMVKNMIAVGEESGSLEESLQTVCEFYDEEVQHSIAGLTQAIEPILTIFLGAFVLFLALAIFLPWWDLTNLYKS